MLHLKATNTSHETDNIVIVILKWIPMKMFRNNTVTNLKIYVSQHHSKQIQIFFIQIKFIDQIR